MTADPRIEGVVRAQIGRAPRGPWRVAAWCSWRMPTVIVSPSVLADGTPYPTYAWLTCPHLSERCAAMESAGEAARMNALMADDPEFAARVHAASDALAAARERESVGVDACAGLGTAGTRLGARVKCLHAHVAARLAGIDDPIGTSVIAIGPAECASGRCRAFDLSTEETL